MRAFEKVKKKSKKKLLSFLLSRRPLPFACFYKTAGIKKENSGKKVSEKKE